MSFLARAMTEAEFMRQVKDLAKLYHWNFIYHPLLSKWSEKGWPDLFMAREKDGRVLLAELKTDKGKLSDRQSEVIDILRGCGLTVHVWRPSDFDDIKAALQ